MDDDIKKLIINIPYSTLERSLEILALAGLFLNFYLIASTYGSLPGQLPRHYGFDGQVDAYGSKNLLVAFLIVPVFMYIIFKLAIRFPQICNYPFKLTLQNAVAQVTLTRKMLLWLLTEIIWFFLYTEWATIQVALGNLEGLGPWFVIIFLVTIFGTIGIYFRKVYLAR